jgi:Xaa-Pro aminopeptidase
MIERLRTIRGLLEEDDADAVLITHMPDVRWACGFTGSSGLLIVSRTSAHFVTDGRYAEQSAREVKDASLVVASSDLLATVANENLLGGYERLAFQADDLTVRKMERLRGASDGAVLVPKESLLDQRRAVKSADEVASIRKAQAITEAVFEDVLDQVGPGMTERELAAEIVYAHLRRGAERMSFDPIVAFGPNTALPHARPSDRVLGSRDVVLLDFGCVVDGYASDMTRTIAIGDVDDDFREVYDLVARAQDSALKACRAGMAAADLDGAARGVIEEAGFGEYFSHSLGHGVGLETHEWPRVSRTSSDVITDGCVVTIEPGVYLPGRFGVRIEDMVVARPDGSENLTSTTRQLIVL